MCWFLMNSWLGTYDRVSRVRITIASDGSKVKWSHVVGAGDARRGGHALAADNAAVTASRRRCWPAHI